MEDGRLKRFETHSHTTYSNIRLIDSINKPKELIKTAYEKGYSGIAFTDHEFVGNMIDVLDSEKELKESGAIPQDFKIALGNEIYLTENRDVKSIEKYFHFLLIAKDTKGHEGLRKLSSNSWYNAYKDKGMWRVPTTKQELSDLMQEYKGHIIADTACFMRGTKIKTLEGEKNIEDITDKDFVLNKDGQWEQVNYPTSRYYSGEGREITFFENTENLIRCTENHKFLVSSCNWNFTKNPVRWVEAKDLVTKKGSLKNYCLFPITPHYTENDIIYKTEWAGAIRKISYDAKYKLPDKIKITPEIMRFFGLWLGDGYISITEKQKKIGVTFSEEEYPYYWNGFVKTASEELNIHWNITKNISQHKVEINSSSIEAIELFYFLFGLSHAKNKYVPNRLKHISEELDWNLFFGYALADGYFRKRTNKSKGEIICASISRSLILGMKEILQSLGIRASFQVNKERIDKNNVHHHESYYLSSSNNAWCDVKKREIKNDILTILQNAQAHDAKKHIVYNGVKYKKVYIKNIQKIKIAEDVFCLNNNSHSFCCENIIVHNCIGNEIFYCMEKGDYARIDSFVKYCIDLFGEDFYFEIAPCDSSNQIKYNNFIKRIAKAYKIKIVIGTDAHYYTKKDRYVHKSFLLSKDEDGLRETDEFYARTYLMSNEEVEELISYFTKEEIEQCYLNSIEIRDKIQEYHLYHPQVIPQEKVTVYAKNLCPVFDKEKYPTVRSFLDGDDIQDRYWANECYRGLKEKNIVDDEHLARIEKEADILNVISQKLGVRMTSYHNTLKQYIDMMWEEGSIVGPGRGSSVGFLSNYCLGITQLDPVQWGLAEWRYLNKERVELGDIDLDQSSSKRKRILNRIREQKGGDTQVLQVATFGSVSTKSAILTACRGYRQQDNEGNELYPDGINIDTAQYMSSLIEQERGFLWPLKDCFEGDEEKDRKPNVQLINEVEKYPHLKDIMFAIEGLIDKRGTHASGVIIYDVEPWRTNAVMRAPDGSLTTQMDLHKSESAGDLKYDFLVTDMCDKIGTTLQLLQENGVIDKKMTLRQAYNKYLAPNVINLKDNRIWDALGNNSVINIFQFNTGVGLDTALLIKPKSPEEMTCCNGLLRLTAEKGKERPLNKYNRFRKNIQLWYQEMDNYGLTKEQEKMLEPYLLVDYGVTPYQESMMRVLMDEKIAHFSLKDANSARKICAKKQMSKIPALKQQIFDNMRGEESFAKYIWECVIEPQMSYSFSINHSLPYSFVGIQGIILAIDFPTVFWNTANLIVDSGGMDDTAPDEAEEEIVSIYEPEDWEGYEYEDLPDRSGKKKKKVKTVDYGKIATAIGRFKNFGITVAPPNINSSSFTFTPVVETNTILYGLRGIARISTDLVNEIIAKRPFSSMADFLSRININRLSMVNLIKCGAFDEIENKAREEIMDNYITSISDHKDKLTLQNMNEIIQRGLIPENMKYLKTLYNFNKVLKSHKAETYYIPGEQGIDYLVKHGCADDLIDGEKIPCKIWDKKYTKAMTPLRDYLKEHSDELVKELNATYFAETKQKYASGNISKWEMESLNFYSHPHELAAARRHFTNFFKLPEEPAIEKTFESKDGKSIPIYALTTIAGTVINRDKMKNTITLLTVDGVVNVKIYKSQFAVYDRQLSFIKKDGTKVVVEKSWFTRGNLLMIQGFRRGQDFIPKAYKSSPNPALVKINGIDKFGNIDYQKERLEVEEEE